jgi:hypothetical protein
MSCFPALPRSYSGLVKLGESKASSWHRMAPTQRHAWAGQRNPVIAVEPMHHMEAFLLHQQTPKVQPDRPHTKRGVIYQGLLHELFLVR